MDNEFLEEVWSILSKKLELLSPQNRIRILKRMIQYMQLFRYKNKYQKDYEHILDELSELLRHEEDEI